MLKGFLQRLHAGKGGAHCQCACFIQSTILKVNGSVYKDLNIEHAMSCDQI